MTIGQQYKLLYDFGNQAFDRVVGVRHGIQAGAIGTVVDEVAADEQGAHNNEEDCYVLEFADEAKGIDSDGNLSVAAVTRRLSFGVALFDPANPDRQFEAV